MRTDLEADQLLDVQVRVVWAKGRSNLFICPVTLKRSLRNLQSLPLDACK